MRVTNSNSSLLGHMGFVADKPQIVLAEGALGIQVEKLHGNERVSSKGCLAVYGVDGCPVGSSSMLTFALRVIF